MTDLSISEAPSWDGRRTAALTHPPFEAAFSGESMLRDAEKEARQRGYEAMVGPMAGDTWGSYRVMLWSDGSPAFVGEPSTGPFDLEAYLRAGFALAETHFSAAAAPGPRGFATAGPPDVTVVAWDGREPAALLAEAHGVVMTAFAKTAFFRPIPRDRFIAAYLPGLAHADPRFVLAARDPTGRSVGFALAYPDPIRKGAIVLKTYAALVSGIGRRMGDIVHSRAAELGFTEVIHALMRDGGIAEPRVRRTPHTPLRPDGEDPVTLLEVFLRRADEHPDRTAIVDPDGTSTTYAELAAYAGNLASTWTAQGIDPGDRVLVAVWPSIRLYASLAAIWQCGAVAVLPEASMGLAGLRQAAATAKPKAILADLPIRLLTWFLLETRDIPLRLLRHVRHDARLAAFHRATASDAALISFTSGTTGRPKGMVRSHGLLLAQHEALAALIAPRREGEVDLVAFPAFVLTCLGHGTTVVMPDWDLRRHDRVSAADISRRARASGATRLLVPPVITGRLAQEGLTASVDRVLTGGGPIYPDVARTFLARNPGIGLTIVYGSTEAEPISYVDAESLSEDDWRDAAHGGGLPVGRPVPQATVRIDAGELLVAGPHVNESYLDAAMDAGIKLRIGDRVFHRTGDAGRFDSNGRLWLLGRMAASREGLHPFAIETAARMQPGVRGAALVAVEDRTILFIEGQVAGFDRNFEAQLETLSIEACTIPAIPLDRRHRSKPDYAALIDVATRRS